MPKDIQRENMLANVLCNVFAPALIMMKGSALTGAPPVLALCVALAFPLGYFVYDLVRRRKRNFLSILGFVSTLITGGVGLAQLPADWIAIKEAAVPGLFAIAVLATAGTKTPLVQAFLLNPDFFDMARIDAALEQRGTRDAFRRTMRKGTLMIALSFTLSSVLNYVLARLLVHSPGGTEAFNSEMGRMQLLSYPVIALPVTVVSLVALWIVVKGVKTHAGLSLEQIVPEASRKQ
jgi:hypothetical protein